jgi:hypothetical protein
VLSSDIGFSALLDDFNHTIAGLSIFLECLRPLSPLPGSESNLASRDRTVDATVSGAS